MSIISPTEWYIKGIYCISFINVIVTINAIVTVNAAIADLQCSKLL